MFRLVVSNILAHNCDAHIKDFSFLLDAEGPWKLSPTYALSFSSCPGTNGGEGDHQAGWHRRNDEVSLGGEWLNLPNGNRNNRMRVLMQWVNKIVPYAEGALTNIDDLPYQFVHRFACACDKNPAHAVLLYQLFIDDETRPTLDKMLSVLTAAKDRINLKSNLKVLFQQIECKQVKHYAGDKLKNIFFDMKSDRGGAYHFPGD